MILNESLFEEYSDNNEQLYREIASQVRKEVVDKYGEDFLYGKCIEASDRIVDLLSKEGVNAAAVEGWVHYDYDDGCTDRDYDEHTWVETQDGYVIDVTATQFNHFMDEDYPDIIISKELPYGYSYDEPDTYEDGDWSYKNLFEKKDIIENLPQYLYHATYPHRWKMIKQAGGLKTHLNRRLRNWSDSRDVICLSEDPDAAESYAETALDELDKDWDIIVLKIDTKYLDKSCLSYDANILYDEEDAEEGFEQTEYEYSKDIPLEAISLTLVEAAKRKKKQKKISQVNPGEAIFKSVKDMQKWVKKRQKGWGSFVHIDNCGNMDYNNDMFNKMHGLGDTSSSSTADGGASDAAPSGGEASIGMGESLKVIPPKKELRDYLTTREISFIKSNQNLLNNQDWIQFTQELNDAFLYKENMYAIIDFLKATLPEIDFSGLEHLINMLE